MDSQQLFKLKDEVPPDEAGKSFFEETPGEAGEFFRAIIKTGDYEYIAAFFAGAGLWDENGFNSGGEFERGFSLFLGLMETYGIGFGQYSPLLFAVYKANGLLKNWKTSVERYLSKLLYADFEGMARVLLSSDTSGLSYPSIIIAGRSAGQKLIADELMGGIVKNKPRARALIRDSDVVLAYAERYETLDKKARAECVKLLLQNKRSTASIAWIDRVYITETSRVIKRLIDKDAVIAAKGRKALPERYSKDDKGLYASFEFDKIYKIRVRNFRVRLPRVKNIAARPALKEKVRAVRKDIRAKTEYLINCMVTGELWSYSAFCRKTADPLMSAMCERLFFMLQTDDAAERMVIIDKGRVLGLDGRLVSAEDKFLCVAHPLSMTGEYAYLTMAHDLGQPFDQIGREVFEASEADKSFNVCERFRGALTSVAGLRRGIRGSGFKYGEKNDDGDCVGLKKLWHGILCIVKTSPFRSDNADDLVRLDTVRFFAEDGGAMSISAIDPRLYSEFLYGIRLLTKA